MLSYLTLSAICFISGVYACDFFPSNRISDLIAVIIISGAMLSLFLKKNRKYILIASLFLVTGIIGCNIQQNPAYNDFYPLNNKYVTIDGYISDLPEENAELYSYKLKTTRIEYLDKEYSPGQEIKISSDRLLNYGDTIRVKGFLKSFSDKKNSSDFNVKRYYQSRGIFYRMYARELEYIDINQKNFPLTYYINLIKSKYANAIDKEFSGNESAILKAITLGNKRQFSSDFDDLLTKTGFMKFFYPSFLHIYLISAIILLLFKHIKKSIRDYILIACLIFYAMLNSHSPTLVKNVISVIIGIFILKKYGFKHHSDIIALAILIVCISNPLYCFDVGFIISLSTGLTLYYFKDILDSLLSFIPFRSVRSNIIFYIISTLGLLPIISYFFNGVSLYTNLLSPIYIIVVSALIVLVPIMCILTSIFGSAYFIKTFISWFLWYFKDVPFYIDKLPFSHIWIKPPDFIFIAAFFLTLYIVYQIYMNDIKKSINMCAIFCSAGLWCSILFNHLLSIGDMNITFVNVGQGDGVVATIKGGETFLIDGGGKSEFSDYDPGKQIYAPYLADNGYFNIDKAFVSHYHSDHCLGIIAAMKLFNIKEVILPNYDKNNKYRLEIEQIAKHKNINITYATKGDIFKLSPDTTIKILSPGEEELAKNDENEASLVMQVEHHGVKCLFTGDIGIETEKKLLNNVDDCDIVKVAHHGSANSNCIEFAQAVNAEYAIVSMGEDNIYAFPKPEAVYNYQQSGAKVARTDVNGDITVNINKNGTYKIYRYLNE